jgi:hypothetical protein
VPFSFASQASFKRFCDSASNRRNQPLHFAILFRIAKSIHQVGATHLTTAPCIYRHLAMSVRIAKRIPLHVANRFLRATSIHHILRSFLASQIVSASCLRFVFKSQNSIFSILRFGFKSQKLSITFCMPFSDCKMYPAVLEPFANRNTHFAIRLRN